MRRRTALGAAALGAAASVCAALVLASGTASGSTAATPPPSPSGTSASGSATSASPSSTPVPAPPPAPDVVLPRVPLEAGSVPGSSAQLVAAVRAALRDKALGRDVAAMVVDVGSGDVLLDDRSSVAQVPASTLKTLTAVTALSALGGSTRITTSVVEGAAPGEVVLVGAGDATLTRYPTPASDLPEGQSARPASLADLANRTVKALRAKGVSTVSVQVDDSLFTGPRTAPGWPSTYVSTGVVSPVSALSADSGKVSADSRVRSADPAIAAGRFFAKRLEAAGLTVTGEVGRTDVGSAADPIASVQSPTMADLVERMLTASDNDLAEALAHLSGLVVAQDASFAGGAKAVEETLQELGITVSGLELVDGSGLSRENRVAAATLAGTLSAAVRDAPPTGATAGVLWPTTSGLPIAGATGTLAERFDTTGTDAGRGVVRGKTGTLSGVVTLAGCVVDAEGRMRVFVFLADASPGPLLDAQAALDRAATAVVTSP